MAYSLALANVGIGWFLHYTYSSITRELPGLLIIYDIHVRSSHWDLPTYYYFITPRYSTCQFLDYNYIRMDGWSQDMMQKFEEIYPDFELLSIGYEQYKDCLAEYKRRAGCRCKEIKCKRDYWKKYMILKVYSGN